MRKRNPGPPPTKEEQIQMMIESFEEDDRSLEELRREKLRLEGKAEAQKKHRESQKKMREEVISEVKNIESYLEDMPLVQAISYAVQHIDHTMRPVPKGVGAGHELHKVKGLIRAGEMKQEREDSSSNSMEDDGNG